MTGILLDATPAVNGADVVLGVKDAVFLFLGILGVSTAFITLKLNFNSETKATGVKFDSMEKGFEAKLEAMEKDVNAEKLTRHSMKKEISRDAKEVKDTLHNRIDKVREDFTKEIEKNREEFGKINVTMSEVKENTAELKGMIQGLIDKKN